ncbi:hypothetical protein EMCRGX_G013186 [Ephydatia muelleri]
MEFHCRVCGGRLVVAKKSKRTIYNSLSYKKELKLAFGIDEIVDHIEIHPPSFCKPCKLSMDRVLHTLRQNKLVPFRSLVTPYKWKAHTADKCEVADKFEGAFARLGACHSIYDQCFVTDEKCAELDKAIVCIMDYFGTNFPNEISPPKCTYWRITQWSVSVEKGNRITRDHTTPADILIAGRDRGKPATLDITITSPLLCHLGLVFHLPLHLSSTKPVVVAYTYGQLKSHKDRIMSVPANNTGGKRDLKESDSLRWIKQIGSVIVM